MPNSKDYNLLFYMRKTRSRWSVCSGEQWSIWSGEGWSVSTGGGWSI